MRERKADFDAFKRSLDFERYPNAWKDVPRGVRSPDLARQIPLDRVFNHPMYQVKVARLDRPSAITHRFDVYGAQTFKSINGALAREARRNRPNEPDAASLDSAPS